MIKGIHQRIDEDFKKELEELTKQRLQKGLIKMKSTDLGFKRATKRLLRCPSWKNIREEYITLPEREK